MITTIKRLLHQTKALSSIQIQDFCHKNKEISSNKNVMTQFSIILDNTWEEFTTKEKLDKLLKNEKLVGIKNNFFIDKMEDQKLKKLIKTCKRAKKNVEIC